MCKCFTYFLHSSYKDGCEAQVYASVDKVRPANVIRKIVTEHSHEVSERVVQQFPESRRLTEKVKNVSV